jgi:DNA primase
MTVRCCLLMKLQVLAADTQRAALLAEEEQLLSDTLDADDENTAVANSAKNTAVSKQQQRQQKQPLSEEQWSANMARLSAIGEELAAIGADAAEGIATVTLLLYQTPY